MENSGVGCLFPPVAWCTLGLLSFSAAQLRQCTGQWEAKQAMLRRGQTGPLSPGWQDLRWFWCQVSDLQLKASSCQRLFQLCCMEPVSQEDRLISYLVHCTDVTFGTSWRQDHPPVNRLRLTLLQYFFYFGGLELNLQYHHGMPVYLGFHFMMT